MGGGNPNGIPAAQAAGGLSPHGRGKRISGQCSGLAAGSIPAWAGETKGRLRLTCATTVYPRMGGGNTGRKVSVRAIAGLSQHGRGKQRQQQAIDAVGGSIPAWAGETPPFPPRTALPAVYPRMGGGNAYRPPRTRLARGLSPHGRGKPAAVVLNCTDRGSIPAWAGETAVVMAVPVSPLVYPRMGGGNPSSPVGLSPSAGLSPHGRGKRTGDGGRLYAPRSIPAWAGETPACKGSEDFLAVYPRMGGGNRQPERDDYFQ